MADTIIPNEGLILQHQDSLQIGISGRLPWRLMLWKNDYLPVPGTVLASLTECDFAGYGRFTVDPTLWTGFDAVNGCSHATWKSVPTMWLVNGGPTQTVYGWAMVDEGMGIIKRVQRFDPADIAPLVIGVPFLLLPRVTFTSAACS